MYRDDKLEKKLKQLNDESNKQFDVIFALIKDEFGKHIANIFGKTHDIWIDVNGELHVRFLENDPTIREELYDIMIVKLSTIDDYRQLIRWYIDDKYIQDEWMNIFEYFEYRMWNMQISEKLLWHIDDYNKTKNKISKINNHNLYKEFLLSNYLYMTNDIENYFYNLLKDNDKKDKIFWSLQLWINDDWEYFVGLIDKSIMWKYLVIKWKNLNDIIWLFGEELVKLSSS